jgi:hypothetical protein
MSEIKIIKPSMYFLTSQYRFEFPYPFWPGSGSQCKELTVQNYAATEKGLKDQDYFIVLCRIANGYNTKEVAIKISNFLKEFESKIKEKEVTTIIIKNDYFEIHVPKMWRINSVIFSFFLSIVKWGILFDNNKHKNNGINKIGLTFKQEKEEFKLKKDFLCTNTLPEFTGQISSFKKVASLIKKKKSIYESFNELTTEQWQEINLTPYNKNGMNEFCKKESTLREMCLKEVKK